MTTREQLAARIEAAGITPAELARRSGVHPTVISRYLRGHRDVYTGTLDKLLAACERKEAERG